MTLAQTKRFPRAHALSLWAALWLGCAGETAATRTAGERAIPREPLAAQVELAVGVEDSQRVVLELRNAGAEALQLPDGYARIDVRREGEPVRTCARTSRAWVPLETGGVHLAPGEAHRVVTPLGCALEETGEHSLLVDVVLGEEVDPRRPAPTAEYLASSGTFHAGAEDRLALSPDARAATQDRARTRTPRRTAHDVRRSDLENEVVDDPVRSVRDRVPVRDRRLRVRGPSGG